jgi:UrcA family protein
MATPKLFATTLLAATTLAISAPASAHWKTKVVAHADLDLSTAKGQERFKTRVKQAVKQVCASPRAVTISEKLDQSRCETEAMASAMPRAERTIASYLQKRQMASLEKSAIVGN